MNLSSHKTRLEQLLDAASLRASALLSALENERAALGGIDPAALEAACEIKRDCIGTLEALENERKALCASLGFAVDTDGMRCLLGALRDASVSDRWEALLAKLAQCRDYNQVNGALVARQRHQVKDSLGLLRGESLQQRLYGPDGAATAAARSQSLASA